MRVAHVIPNLGVGGAEVMLLDLIEAQQKSGLVVLPVILWPRADSHVEARAEQLASTLYLGKRPGLDLKVIGRARQALDEFHPEIVHTHRDAFRYVYAGSVRREWRMIHTIHNRPEREAVRRLDRILRRQAFRTRRVRPVALSVGLGSEVARFYGLDRCDSVVNGVPMVDPLPTQATNGRRVIYVGRLTSDKRPQDAVRAVARVRAAGLDLNLDIFGDGELRPVLQELIQQLGLDGLVRLMGTSSEIRTLLPSYDALINTSAVEGQPISILEAMSSRVAVIASDVGAAREMLASGERGRLVDCSDIEGFAAALREVFSQPTRTGRAVRRAADYVRATHSSELMALGYQALYADIAWWWRRS